MRLVKVLFVRASLAAILVLSTTYLSAQHLSAQAVPAQGASAQQPDSKVTQTARQALIDIFSGTGDLTKHLTVEVQKELQSGTKAGVAFSPAMMLGDIHSVAGSHFKTFDTGSILLSTSNPKKHERMEIQVDSDDLNADQDTMQLSIHQFRDEKEINTPFQFISQISIGMKKQENIWRLNEIAIGAKFPVGDPGLFKRLVDPNILGGGGESSGMYGANVEVGRPKLNIEDIVRSLSYQEEMYASQHPEQGFACSLTDLMGEAGTAPALGLDPQVKIGLVDGFRISVTGCQGIPAASFQITAEPLSPSAGSKAFCTDATHNVRQSDDGRGPTCLTSGRVPSNRSSAPGAHTEIVVH
jgi:hypothetical protein